MSARNGTAVVRISRKGRRTFAIGDEDDERALPPFEIDVVTAFNAWLVVDASFRPEEEDAQGNRFIPTESVPAFHRAAVEFVEALGGPKYANQLETAEALDFLARLRECYDDLADFFRYRSREERASPGTGAAASANTSAATEMRFSHEPGAAPKKGAPGSETLARSEEVMGGDPN